MALNRYVLTATVTVPADTIATVVAGEPGTGGASGFGSAQSVSPATATKFGLWPMTFLSGQAIVLDPAGALYAAIGAGNLTAWIDGASNVGHQALSN